VPDPLKTRALRRAGLVVFALAVLLPASVAAQGKGNANGKNKNKAGSGPSTSGAAAPTHLSAAAVEAALALGGTGVRQFGAWLDDATIMTPGDGWVSIAFGHYRSAGSRQTDFPSVDSGIGISRRVQFGLSVPYYRVHFPDGTTVGGIGDVFLSSKVLLLEPRTGRPFGLAVSPVVEITQDPLPDRGSFTWAAPVSVEVRGQGFRAFASSGYFSRGALFGSAAVEVPVTERLVATGALTLMRSTRDDLTADALGLSKGRTDLTASAAYFMTPWLAVFAGTGRTLGNADGTGTTFMLNGGVSVTVMAR
jgi:hypothetical protein